MQSTKNWSGNQRSTGTSEDIGRGQTGMQTDEVVDEEANDFTILVHSSVLSLPSLFIDHTDAVCSLHHCHST